MVSIQLQGLSKEDIVIQYKSMTIEAVERRARPPPEPPSWSASKPRVWKKMGELCFNSVLFCLCFSFELHVVLDVFLFPSRVILDFKLGDEKFGLLVIGSVKPITESANIIASTEIYYLRPPKFGTRKGGTVINKSGFMWLILN
ncbi:unnamed protein product [Cuscuta epithymum]|uniref:Uncharacterized protein n=1 Tax=Cuscuta epithymum TaxID=186058 RepID=A0AAV0EEX0_9ASTE|nr:unnamed protein product [Cuscuta epithymum]